MTPNELRIRCAEIEGIPLTRPIYFFRFGDTCKPKRYSCEWHSKEEAESQREACSKEHEVSELLESFENLPIPDYCNSIDAINAAVLRLSEEKLETWEYALEEELFGMMNQALRDDPGHRAALATASAIERATAFAAIHSK